MILVYLTFSKPSHVIIATANASYHVLWKTIDNNIQVSNQITQVTRIQH